MQALFFVANNHWLNGDYHKAYNFFNEALSDGLDLPLFKYELNELDKYNDFEQLIIKLLTHRSNCNYSTSLTWQKVWNVAPFQFMISALLMVDFKNDPDEIYIEFGGDPSELKRKPLKEDYADLLNFVIELVDNHQLNCNSQDHTKNPKPLLTKAAFEQLVEESNRTEMFDGLIAAIQKADNKEHSKLWLINTKEQEWQVIYLFFYQAFNGKSSRNTIENELIKLFQNESDFCSAFLMSWQHLKKRGYSHQQFIQWIGQLCFIGSKQLPETVFEDIQRFVETKDHHAFYEYCYL